LGQEMISKLQRLDLRGRVKPLGVWRFGDSGPSEEVFEAMGLDSKALVHCILQE
jgi:transketolase